MTAIDRSGATLVAPRAALNFFDAQSVALPRPVTPLAAWNHLMAHPLPLMATAFRLRDAISARFGVKRIGGFSGAPRDHVQPGDMLDFFRVEAVSDHELVLTERDRHLDVMTSVMVRQNRLCITSSVITHNLFGKLYMLPVGPAHRLIVHQMLRRLSRSLSAAAPPVQ